MAIAQRFMVDSVLTATQYAYMLKVIGYGAAPIGGCHLLMLASAVFHDAVSRGSGVIVESTEMAQRIGRCPALVRCLAYCPAAHYDGEAE